MVIALIRKQKDYQNANHNRRYKMTDEQTNEPSIWGQPSDIDFLGPATTVGEYEEMIEDAFDDEDAYQEDISFLSLE